MNQAETIFNGYGIDVVQVGGIWGGTRVYWADEAKGARRVEAIYCQTIDANCNDCKHLVRTGMAPSIWPGEKPVPHGECGIGHRGDMELHPGTCMDNPCFEHRNGAEPRPEDHPTHNFAYILPTRYPSARVNS